MNEDIKNTAKKTTLLIDLQYFPPISYIKEIVQVETIVLEAHETYQKQTFRNRCEILTANGKEALIIPIIHGSSGYIKDIKIDYSQRWFKIHDRTLRSAYGKSPFFEFVMDDISQILETKQTFLWDLNYKILTLCLEKLTLKRKIIESNVYLDIQELDHFVLDLRGKIIPNSNKEIGHNGSDVYHQVFGNEFVSNLSILDLLFCAVLDSPKILR